jgi:hypothetical protein
MKRIIDLTLALIFGTLFSLGIILIIAIMFIVIVPLLVFFTIKEVLKQLTNTK